MIDLHPDEYHASGTLEDYAEFVRVNKQLSEDTYSSYYRALQRWYDIWRNFVKVTRGHKSRWNNIPIPFLQAISRSGIARKMDIQVGRNPWIQAQAMGPEDIQAARKQDRLTQAQFEMMGFRGTLHRLHLNADLFGHSIYRLGWKVEAGRTYRREPTNLHPGLEFLGRRVSVKEVKNPRTGLMGTTFNGPWIDAIDNSDFFPFPGYDRIHKGPGGVERYFLDFEDLVVLSQPGPNGEKPVFFPEVVEQMRYAGQTRGTGEGLEERRNAAAGGVDDRTYMKVTKFSKPVVLWEWQGRVPRGMSVTDPDTGEEVTQCVITLADMKWPVRVAPIDTWDKKVAWGSYHPIDDPRWFHTPGKMELGERLQWAINKWVSRKADALDAWIDPIVLFDENSDLDPNRFMAGPGAFVSVNGPVDEKVIRQLIPDLRGVQLTYTEIEQMFRWLLYVLGVSEDISLGGGQKGNRESAQSAFQRARAVGVLSALEVMACEEQVVEVGADRMMEMNRQYLTFPVELGILGVSAVIDPVTMRVLPPIREELSLEEMNINRRTRALGATRYISEQMRMQGVASFLSVMQPLLPAIRLSAFVRQTLPMFTFDNVDELVKTDQEILAAEQAALVQAASESMDPQSKPRGTGGSQFTGTPLGVVEGGTP